MRVSFIQNSALTAPGKTNSMPPFGGRDVRCFNPVARDEGSLATSTINGRLATWTVITSSRCCHRNPNVRPDKIRAVTMDSASKRLLQKAFSIGQSLLDRDDDLSIEHSIAAVSSRGRVGYDTTLSRGPTMVDVDRPSFRQRLVKSGLVTAPSCL